MASELNAYIINLVIGEPIDVPKVFRLCNESLTETLTEIQRDYIGKCRLIADYVIQLSEVDPQVTCALIAVMYAIPPLFRQ